MKEKSKIFFNNIIMPMISDKHPDVLHEMSFQIQGSVGLGIDDEFSDVEAAIWLPDEIWKKNGMLQISLDKCLAENNLWKQDCSGIQVYPLSWILDGKGEKILAGGDVPWGELAFDSLFGLFTLHNQPIWHDPQDRLGKLRKMTAPEKMPEIFWKKALLEKIENFVSDGMQELNKCIDRKHYVDAFIPLGDAVKALLEIGFIISRSYYPYRKHLSWAFSRLPLEISGLKCKFNLLSEATDWQIRLYHLEEIYTFYKDYILSSRCLPELDFNRVDLREMPMHDNEFYIAKNILDNPNWRAEQDIIMEKTLKLGLQPEAARWVSWWDMV